MMATVVRATSGRSVRAVERALAILQAMNRRPLSSVEYLHHATGLPKSTLVRLLQTMIRAGYVANDARQSGYQLTSLVTSLSRGFQDDPLVVHAGRAWAVNLTRRIKWPVSIAVFDIDAMVIRFSTVGDSPMSPFHSSINMRLSLFSRALGRAYLAYCTETERALLVSRYVTSTDPENALARQPKALRDLMDEIRSVGYAVRDPTIAPHSNTVAMPILYNDAVVATIGMTYSTSAIPSIAAIDCCIERLRETTRQIESEVNRLEQTYAAGSAPASVR